MAGQATIRVITRWEKGKGAFYAPGALVQVKGGQGRLGEGGFSEGGASYFTLLFDGKPLFQLQGDEYFCPTCEKIIRSGYQLEQTEEFHGEIMNGENVPFEEALQGLAPLLGLLRDNCYVVLDTQLCPTDGNGHIFWNVPDSGEKAPGSCLFYRGDGSWGFARPHFTVATQSLEKLSEKRVEYYRGRPGCRAVAYYMDGYMTALIDGHHKAMAAALEHRSVHALVIMPCHPSVRYENGGRGKEYLVAGEMRFPCGQYGVKAAQAHKKVGMQRLFPAQGLPFPYDNERLAAAYPGAGEISDVDAYVDEYGEVTDERLDRVLAGEHVCARAEIRALLKALGGLKSGRLFEMADFFLWKCPYLALLGFHDVELFEAIVGQLAKLPHSDELAQYMVGLMVEYEDEYPAAAERIKEWL